MKQNFYTKIFFLLIALWGVGGKVKGQLLFNYDFTGLTTGANLAGQDGWTKGGTGPDATVENTTPLVYTGYNGGGGNYVQSPAGNATSSRVYRGFTSTPIGTNTFFYSFLLRVSSTSTVSNGNYFISLGDPGTGTAYFARVAAVQGTSTSKFRIGGSKLSNTFTLGTTEYDVNVTYLVVVKYVSVTGTTNDEMYIWVNPSLASEPSNATAEVTVPTSGADPTLTGGNVGNFHWHNRNIDNATVAFDGVRVAYGANSSDAWTNLGASAATPSLSVTPASLSGFTTTAGTPSASQSYSLSGANLTPASGNITVTAPTNFEVSLDNSAFSPSVSVPYSSSTLSATTIYVRIAASAPAGSVSGNVTHSGGGVTTPPSVAVSGTVNPATPFLNVSPASLSGFTTTSGTPSTSQNYSLSGGNLSPASGNITVTAPTNFEVSLDNSAFSPSVSVPYSSSTLSATTIYVRIAASAPAGSVSGNVTHAGGGVTTPPSVAVSGTVNPATPFLNVSPASLSGFTTTSGTPSTSQNYSLSGGNLSPASGNITVTAPTNFEVSLDNSAFSPSVSVPYSSSTLSATTIYVRIAASAPAGSVSGNVTHAGGGVTTPPSVAVNGNVSAPFTPVYEPFAGTGNLNGQNGWAVHSGTANQVQRIAGNLNYPGLETATGNKIQILSTQSEDLNKGFTSLTTGNVYASFVMRVSDVSKFQTNTNVGTYFMHFAEEAGTTFSTFNFVARVYVRQGTASNTYQLGILSKGGGSPTAGDIFGSSPQDLAINTNYFVVIKYNIATQASSIFINPVPGSPEPTPTFTSTFGTSIPTDIESICIRNSNTSGVGTGDIEIDELRVGITWAQVTPPNTSPVINVNPATLNNFNTNVNTASAVQDYIVSASNLTSNLVITAPAGFEIKRSTDATYASSVTLVPTGGNVPNTTINVRLAASNTNAKILIANITNTSGTLTETVGVRGVVNATLPNFPDTPKDQVAAPQTYTFSAVGLTENLVITNNDNQNYALSKDGNNFANSISFTPAEVNNNNVTISVRFQPKSNINGLKPVNIEHSANSLTSIVSTEGRQLEPLSIADELAAQTIIFPNPANKYVQIQTNGVYQVVVQDITGRKVAQCNSNEVINTEKLPNGLYFLQFSNENVKFVKRLIIQK